MIKKVKVHYIRVSTTAQNTATQEEEVKEGYIPSIEPPCSGSVPFAKRKEGADIIQLAKDGRLSEVLVHRLDRLGRNTVDILNTIQFLTAQGVNVVSLKEGLSTLGPDGKENPTAKLLIGILSTIAEFELDRITERRTEGIAAAKERGSYRANGRKKGEGVLSNKQLLDKYKKVVKVLIQGNSIRNTAKLCSVSTTTVQKVKDAAITEGVLKS